jgi:hypothetical protein
VGVLFCWFESLFSGIFEGEMEQKTITLNSGHKMPVLGLGVWRADPGVIHNAILEALKLGYRHFDCAGISSFP